MELPLSPMEFARRARRLYADREAVIDGDLRLTYSQFFDRCDRWSQVLQEKLGVGYGDRVAYIAPNTHAQLESFYAVPQLGAVVVPINYRLTPDDFAYIIGHSGARVVCAHADYLDAVDGIRDQIPNIEHFVALEGARDGWLDYEQLIRGASGEFLKRQISESDLLSINYTSGTTSRPKGVMITHRNAYINAAGWEICPVDGLTQTAPFLTNCAPRPEHAGLSPEERGILKSRQGVELITSGELTVVDDNSREVPWDGETLGEIVVRGYVVMK